ncbi:AAA family ATPase [Spirosoma oryzicola]|uniref:AAA family ATPase n=1 Tax=Spirosoma oryzicola TaxID=2898794 RepID=UPI001E2E4333|nr:AAA family ATPase [Spirosoma oryzicola]UHG94287.1 AAA family ATPase [Spirosoma oryzicola]
MSKFIITGGPGAGKSTLIEALRAAGFHCFDEISRQLIQQEVASGSQCLPWVDLDCFARLALKGMIADHKRASTFGQDQALFFDRAIPDIIAYLRVGDVPVDALFQQAVQQYPYQPTVFVAPPWEAIYVNDAERWQTFAESCALHDAIVETYQQLNFTLIELPRSSAADRVDFVLSTVSQYVPMSTGTRNSSTKLN